MEKMKRIASLLLVCVMAVGMIGCGEKAKTEKKTTTTTPGGTATTTESKEVKTTGENPPAPAKP
jgi:uncharacterized lipoprotein YehR (DUF1307 family)